MGHGSLGVEPNGMIGAFMISFLHRVGLRKHSGRHRAYTGYSVQYFHWQGAAECGGGKSWPRSQLGSQRRVQSSKEKAAVYRSTDSLSGGTYM